MSDITTTVLDLNPITNQSEIDANTILYLITGSGANRDRRTTVSLLVQAIIRLGNLIRSTEIASAVDTALRALELESSESVITGNDLIVYFDNSDNNRPHRLSITNLIAVFKRLGDFSSGGGTGTPGQNGQGVYLFYRAVGRDSSAPATPALSAFSHTSGVPNAPTGWSTSPTYNADTQKLYTLIVYFNTTTNVFSSPRVTQLGGSNGQDGVGTNGAEGSSIYFFYRAVGRDSSAPTVPTLSSFTQTNNVPNAPTGWLATPAYDADTQKLYLLIVRYAPSTRTFSNPRVTQLGGSNGQDGEGGSTTTNNLAFVEGTLTDVPTNPAGIADVKTVPVATGAGMLVGEIRLTEGLTNIYFHFTALISELSSTAKLYVLDSYNPSGIIGDSQNRTLDVNVSLSNGVIRMEAGLIDGATVQITSAGFIRAGSGEGGGTVDLSNYRTAAQITTEIATAIQGINIPDVSNFRTQAQITTQIANALANYRTATQITTEIANAVANRLTQSQVDARVRSVAGSTFDSAQFDSSNNMLTLGRLGANDFTISLATLVGGGISFHTNTAYNLASGNTVISSTVLNAIPVGSVVRFAWSGGGNNNSNTLSFADAGYTINGRQAIIWVGRGEGELIMVKTALTSFTTIGEGIFDVYETNVVSSTGASRGEPARAIRFVNGIMIQTGRREDVVNLDTTSGQPPVTYLLPFGTGTALPSVNMNVLLNTSNTSITAISRIYNESLTGFTVSYFLLQTTSTAVARATLALDADINYTAIGRWF